MSDTVTCTYIANGPQGANTGTIKLTDCSPSIANTETLSQWDVIGIVAVLVVLGLVGQYILHHINRKALQSIWLTDPAKSPTA